MVRVFRRRRVKKLAALIAGCIAGSGLLAAVAVLRVSVAHQYGRKTIARAQTTVVVSEEKRKVYPYSIVPGGARTIKEAQRAMNAPAVRDHYAAIDLKNLKQVTLTSDLVGYVSYRYGDRIFWTAKKLRLKAGETVFTDGQHIVRGRCLNCYSALPMMPTRHEEPSEKTLNTPMEVPMIALAFPNLPVTPVPPLPPPLAALTPVVPVTGGGGAPGHPGGGRFFPIIPIIPPIHHRHNPTNNTSGTPVIPPVTPTPPVAVVPEPGYQWLLAGAVLALLFASRVRRARRTTPGR